MPKTQISQYDSTAANNTDIDGINTAEGWAPSVVNNAFRELMAHLKDAIFGNLNPYSNDAGAGAGPDIDMHRDSASPADSDLIGRLIFSGEDDGGNKTQFASVECQIDDVTDTEEDGLLILKAMTGGTLSPAMVLGHGANNNSNSHIKVNPPALTAKANANFDIIRIDNDNAITIPSGTTGDVSALGIEAPNYTATGTITDANGIHIVGAPTEGTNNNALLISDGCFTSRGQPSTHKLVESEDTNVTGNGTVYTIAFDTEVYDQDANMGTSTFTAPEAGKYLIILQVDINGMDGSSEDRIETRIVTANDTFWTTFTNANDLPTVMTLHQSIVCTLDKNDAASFRVECTGTGGDTLDITGVGYTYASIAKLH